MSWPDPSSRCSHFSRRCSPKGRPCQPIRIVGPFGHKLEIEYNTRTGSPFIDRLIDGAGEDIDFSYVTKSTSFYTDTLLESVSYQDASTVEYLYEDNAEANRRFLTGIVDEEAIEYASFAYDDQSRAIGSGHADGFHEWTFAYNLDGSTTATDARGIETIFEYQSGVGSGSAEAVGSIARGGDARSKDNETSGQFRLLTSTDERGVVTKNTYNTYHLLSRTEAFGATDVTPRTTEYEYLNDTSQLRTRVEEPSVCVDGTPRFKVTDTSYIPGTQLVDEQTESGRVNQSGTVTSVESHRESGRPITGGLGHRERSPELQSSFR